MAKQPLVKKYGLQLLLVFFILGFFYVYNRTHNTNFQSYKSDFQSIFLEKERKLERLLLYEKHRFEHFGLEKIWERKVDEDFYLHIYRNDSLMFWSSNELPILRFADIHFPSDGILHLQNGWYYAKTLKIGRVRFCASFLIKRDYAYENKDLSNDFAKPFRLPFDAEVNLEPGDFDIKNLAGEYQLTVQPSEQKVGSLESILLLSFLLGVCLVFLIFLFVRLRPKLPVYGQLMLAGIIILFRIVAILYGWLDFLGDLESFQPALYASDELFPSFGDFLLNVLVLVFVIRIVARLFKEGERNRALQALSILAFFGFYLFWTFLLSLTEGLIENSSIPLRIDQLFQLNLYSLLAIASLGALFHSYVLILRRVLEILVPIKTAVVNLFVLTFLSGVAYFLYDINFGYQLLVAALFPMVFLFAMLLLFKDSGANNQFTHGLVFLFLFSVCLAVNMGVFNSRKEKSERELYANQLQTDQDIVTELEFEKVEIDLDKDVFLRKFTDQKQYLAVSDFHDLVERRFFDDFWEQYDMEYFLFDENGEAFIENFNKTKEELDQIILEHGQVSEVNPNVFFIADYIDQFSYFFRYPLKASGGKKPYLYGTFKSKRIPEEIGFPRLLISKNAKVFESLESYSIAKYYQGKLINKYGEYQYPTLISAFKIGQTIQSGYLERGDYNHYFLKRSDGNFILLSTKNLSWIDLLTTFSYLFCFMGLLILPMLFRKKEMRMGASNFTLAMKIQLVMISLVFFSLLIYGWGSGIFVRNQYNDYTNKVISEKLNSVKIEFQSKFKGDKQFVLGHEENNMEFFLHKFSRVFVTDINFYDAKGYMLASSRPRVFNVGLLSEQMNPKAMSAMQVRFESEFIHQEKIGDLAYSSAYQPYFNKAGKLMGYLNLQHFGQQKEFEIQIQRFLMAIVNVFMFLLAISVVVAILVSSWLTAPLRLLQESFSKVNFGQLNEPIQYERRDEIGALVREYNQKIDELAIKAQQLAQSERESAWREMAKQVAHEIKNPLTPMKLSLQHFQRIYNPDEPIAQEKLDKLVASLVEQIDSLTRIANEFSNFAKMPNPHEEKLDMVSLLTGIVEVFGQMQEAEIELQTIEKKVELVADKDMMVRIFNNIVKNATQAVQGVDQGKVVIRLLADIDHVRVQVVDNGMGIREENEKNMFVPYFTTKSMGTGLGLAMVKQMVEIHKGTIRFESKVGEGTTFFVDIPKK